MEQIEPVLNVGSLPGGGQLSVVLRCLQKSELFIEYQKAFEATIGLPLVLRAAGSFRPPLHGSKRTNPFCALMIASSNTCASCLQLQQRVEDEAVAEAKTLQCYAGLSETAVPVRVGEHVLGYLQTGQVFLHAPMKQLPSVIAPDETVASRRRLEAVYLQTRVLTAAQYRAVIRLLVIFAEHLATVSNQLLTSQTMMELP